MVQLPDVINVIENWILHEPQQTHVIVASGMHALLEGTSDHNFRHILDSADLFIPDGFSITWLARRRGFALEKRVTGSALLEEFCRISAKKGYRNFFYGDTKRVLHRLQRIMRARYPNLKIVGCYSPPYRRLSRREDDYAVNVINEARPDVLWVALGLPKQERWMYEHKKGLRVPVMVGVGAAFGFLSGEVNRAPNWIGEHGLEWAWRLVHQPQRVWRRILEIPKFIGLIGLELIHSETYPE